MPERAGQPVTIKALKYDGSLRRSWNASLITKGSDLLIAVGKFEEAVEHHDLGAIEKGTFSYEYFWPNRWYNVFRFVDPEGAFRNFYCNIAMPPRVHGNVLEFIDLDIDVVVWPDGHREVLDLAEFAQNAGVYAYPDEVRSTAFKALEDLLQAIDLREFPFDQATDAMMPISK